jgi:hypothetical protein
MSVQMTWNPKGLIEYANRHSMYRYLASEESLEKAIIKFQRRKICVVS